MERNLAMELVRVTEAAALASARLMGRGDEMAADVAAIEAMRKAFDAIAIDGTVAIGEGAEDAMPKLYVGERVGTGLGPATDVALDALEGAAICAAGGYNALSVIAILLGVGGAPQGVRAAAFLLCVGGEMQARLKPRNEYEAGELRKVGLFDLQRKYRLEELASGSVMCAATGITPGDYLQGVRYVKGGAVTNSVVMRSATRTVRFIEAHHRFEREPEY